MFEQADDLYLRLHTQTLELVLEVVEQHQVGLDQGEDHLGEDQHLVGLEVEEDHLGQD